GVDLSPEFLARARAAAVARGVTVTWEQRAMHDLPWDGAFDGALCMGNSLGGLDDAGLSAVFRAAARALKPAARLVVHTGFIADSLSPTLKDRAGAPLGDIYSLPHRQYDPVQGRLNVDYTFMRGNQVEKKSAFGQIHTYREFCRLVEGGGFE